VSIGIKCDPSIDLCEGQCRIRYFTGYCSGDTCHCS
uniref:Neurotoxin n=1 Tax=Buthus sp. (strain IY-2001) TaxID=411873 RepID=TX1_BUTSQ|nr:RecName: Full=Neurotoxin [Buthus sp. IY-2001]